MSSFKYQQLIYEQVEVKIRFKKKSLLVNFLRFKVSNILERNVNNKESRLTV